jgi:antitoxin VapB
MTATTLFTNNRTQAVRLPAELRMPSDIKRVNVRALGADRIISPLNQTWDSFFLHTPAVSDDFMAQRADQTQPEREAF